MCSNMPLEYAVKQYVIDNKSSDKQVVRIIAFLKTL